MRLQVALQCPKRLETCRQYEKLFVFTVDCIIADSVLAVPLN
jgi:hypothetical protein